MRRIISLLVAVVLILSTLSGCIVTENIRQQQIISNLPEDNFEHKEPIQGATQPAEPEETEPEGILAFTLDQETIDQFYDLLQESEDTALAGSDLKAAEEVADRLDKAYSQNLHRSYSCQPDLCTKSELLFRRSIQP